MGRKSANQLKANKQKRMRRAYLKRYFGMIKVGQVVDKSQVPRGAEGIVDYRHRGNTYWDEYLERKFPSKGMISIPRQRCLDRLDALTQEVLPEMNVVIHRGGITKTIIRYFFSSDYKINFFLKEDWADEVIWKSGVYGSKERAMLCYQTKQINWLTCVPMELE